MTNLDKLQHSSVHNYQQIYRQGTLALSADTKTVDHNLGYIPYARRWAEQISGEVSTLVIATSSTVYHSAYETAPDVYDIKLTTTTFSASSLGVLTLYYRIYIDDSNL